jgi:16S rRNA (guanine1207-N2)-methyltransferase
MSQADRLAFALDAGELALPENGDVCVLRAEPSAFLEAVPRGRLICEQTDRIAYDRLRTAGYEVMTRLACTDAAMIVVNLTRSKAESRGNAARALERLDPGGILVVNGAKTDGIDSLVRELRKILPLEASYSKAHGRVATFRRPEALPDSVAPWAAEAEVLRNPEGDWTQAGTFSPEFADPGSRLLAGAFGRFLKGRVADLGAGWGYLARACLASCPDVTAIDLYEVEKLALDAAERNLRDGRASFHWTDVIALDRARPPYDAVISNPPFHRGRAAEPDLGAGFIAAAARLLKPSGRFLMVANRHLPYEARLDANFRRWDRLAETSEFKVIAATSPRRR